jgi:hypothetical protein
MSAGGGSSNQRQQPGSNGNTISQQGHFGCSGSIFTLIKRKRRTFGKIKTKSKTKRKTLRDIFVEGRVLLI